MDMPDFVLCGTDGELSNEQLSTTEGGVTCKRCLKILASEKAARALEDQKRKAELYDEVWAKAQAMGFMNVTMALAEVYKLRTEVERLTLATSEQRQIIEALTGTDGSTTALLRIGRLEGEVEGLRKENKRLELMVAQADHNHDQDRGVMSGLLKSALFCLEGWNLKHPRLAKRGAGYSSEHTYRRIREFLPEYREHDVAMAAKEGA